MKSKHEGFTLVQVLIVLALSALLAGVTAPVFTFFDRLSVQAELDRFYELCMVLQQRAQLENKIYTLELDLTKHEYRAQDQRYMLSKNVRFGIMPGVKGPPADPTKLLTQAATFPQNTLVFYPTGIIHPGSVYFVDRSAGSLYALTVAVSPLSYIRRYIYASSRKVPERSPLWKAL